MHSGDTVHEDDEGRGDSDVDNETKTVPRFQRRIDADEHLGLANVMEDEIEIAYRLCGWNVERKKEPSVGWGCNSTQYTLQTGMVLLRKNAGRKRIESRGEMSESAERIKASFTHVSRK